MEFFKCCCCCYFLAFFSCLVMMLTFNSSAVGVFVQAEEPSLQIMSHDDDTVEYWPAKMSLYEYGGGDLGENVEEMDDGAGGFSRRSLFWHRFKHIYISYGALSSNRIPCPPRSGRSYYTHNCYFAEGPVHPYIRGCSTITRCRR